MQNTQRKILFFGGSLAPLQPDSLFMASLIEILKLNVKLVDAGSHSISQHLHMAALQYSMSSQTPVIQLIESYRSVEPVLTGTMLGKEAEIIAALADSVLDGSKPDFAICLGGFERYADQIHKKCKERNIPFFGLPSYQGLGEKIYFTELSDQPFFKALSDKYEKIFFDSFTMENLPGLVMQILEWMDTEK